MRLIREVAVRHLFTYSLLSPVLIAGLIFGFFRFYPQVDGWMRYTLIALTVIIGYYLLKRFAVGLVLVYKAFAPMSLRNSCRFTPTCSTY